MKEKNNRFKRFIEEWKRKKGHASENIGGPLAERPLSEISEKKRAGEGFLFIESSEKNEDDNKPRTRGDDALRIVCITSVILSLIAAFMLTGFALYLLSRPNTVGDGEDIEETDGAVKDTESGKIIYIRDYESESGLLSTEELYSLCHRSAVTVIGTVGRNETVGSGFVFSEDGYIATAAHVVSGAEKIYAVTADGTKYEAKLEASDSASDIALLRIEATGLYPVTFGSSSGLLVGERVYAIGTPRSLEYSGTLGTGEITYVNRRIDVLLDNGQLEKRMNLIQTNAELNSGNSGCPLFDGYGRLVGMVSMKLEDNVGLSFALPSDGVQKVLNAMKSREKIDADVLSGLLSLPARLGIVGESTRMDEVFGYRIDGFVDCGSNAATFLRIGDLLIDINGKAVCNREDISSIISEYSSGDRIKATVIRGGQRLTFEITLGQKVS